MQLKNFISKGFPIAYRTVVLLMGLQIVLGFAWLVANLGGVQDFAETTELLEISHTWVLDEYVGIGYPVCVYLARIPASVTGVSYALFLYVFQIAAAFFAAKYFLRKSGVAEGKCALFGAAYLVTVPLAAQFHVAVLPYSFASSLFLVFLGETVSLCRKGICEKKGLCVIALCWLAGALLLPEYLWLMGAVMAVFGILWIKRNGRRFLAFCVLFFSVVLSVCLVSALTVEPHSRGRMEQSVSGMLLARVVWPNVDKNSYFWSEKVTGLFDAETLLEISHEPENVLYVFGYEMEKAYGTEVSRQEYRQMAVTSLKMRTREILLEVGRDFLSYEFPQGAVRSQLRGNGVSYSGWNYNRMQEKVPVLTKYYVNLSLGGFFVLLALIILIRIVNAMGSSEFVRLFMERNPEWILPVFVVVLSGLWYTMEGAGIWDYKNALVISALWASVIVKGLSLHGEVAHEE